MIEKITSGGIRKGELNLFVASSGTGKSHFASRQKLETKLRQMFWDGQLSTPKFDLFTAEGRQAAAKHFANELEG